LLSPHKGSEKNRKRDVNQYYRRDDRDRNVDVLPGRGDIPIMHGDCDGKLKTLEFCQEKTEGK
jgi:hypothetical protein